MEQATDIHKDPSQNSPICAFMSHEFVVFEYVDLATVEIQKVEDGKVKSVLLTGNMANEYHQKLQEIFERPCCTVYMLDEFFSRYIGIMQSVLLH